MFHLTFRGRRSTLPLLHKRSKVNVVPRSKMNVGHAFVVQIAAFCRAQAVLFNALTYAFAWQVQHFEIVSADVANVLLACTCWHA